MSQDTSGGVLEMKSQPLMKLPKEISLPKLDQQNLQHMQENLLAYILWMTGTTLGVYSEGLHILVNLSTRTLTEVDNSLFSKGLSFCPTPDGIDTYTVKKDVLEYVRWIRLKEYFYKDNIDGNFSDVPASRKRSHWCPE